MIAAEGLYDLLFSPLKQALIGKRQLVIIPDPDLAGVPFHLLPTGRATNVETPIDLYRSTPWLLRQFAITVVPTFAAFHQPQFSVENSTPKKVLLGYGDPLIGAQVDGDNPRPCSLHVNSAGYDESNRYSVISSRGDILDRLYGRIGQAGLPIADPQQIRAFRALPDSRCELLELADYLGTTSDLKLGQAATEASLKAMNASKQLRDYRVLAFATHGLVTGEAGSSEPALVLTPPEIATEEDDGLLTASEILRLDLQADLVILSACNTALGRLRDGEALSGLASAFFYAGAKSLLVSHWPVVSRASVALTTGAFRAIAQDSSLGMAQAMRTSMLALLDEASSEREAHPSYWGAFSLVGEAELRTAPPSP